MMWRTDSGPVSPRLRLLYLPFVVDWLLIPSVMVDQSLPDGSGSTRPGTNSAPESTRPRVNSACLFSLW